MAQELSFQLEKKPSVMSHILQMQKIIPNANEIKVSSGALADILDELKGVFREDKYNPVLPLLDGLPVSYIGLQWSLDHYLEEGMVSINGN